MAQPPESSSSLPTEVVSAEHTPWESHAGDTNQAKADLDATLDQSLDVAAPSAESSSEQLPFPAWQRYQLISFLGAGGMGAVYKARDPRLKRYVAVKFLREGQAAAFDTRQRRHFEREARAQARLEHPHICKIPGRCRNSDGIA